MTTTEQVTAERDAAMKALAALGEAYHDLQRLYLAVTESRERAEAQCRVVDVGSDAGWTCNLPPGHDGAHRTMDGSFTVWTWA